MTESSAAWAANIKASYTLNEAQLVMVDEAAKLIDSINAADERIAEEGTILPARGGGIKVNPLVRVANDSRSLLLRYITGLKLPDPELADDTVPPEWANAPIHLPGRQPGPYDLPRDD